MKISGEQKNKNNNIERSDEVKDDKDDGGDGEDNSDGNRQQNQLIPLQSFKILASKNLRSVYNFLIMYIHFVPVFYSTFCSCVIIFSWRDAFDFAPDTRIPFAFARSQSIPVALSRFSASQLQNHPKFFHLIVFCYSFI